VSAAAPVIRDTVGGLPGFDRVFGPNSTLRRGARRAERFLLGRDAVRGVVPSARDYVADELGEPERFVPLIDSESFEGSPGRTVGTEDPLVATGWWHEDWPAWRVFLPGGRVAGKQPLVLTHDRRALRESAADETQLRINPAMEAGLGRAESVPGRLLVLTGPWSWNWYHWLLDVMPRAALLPIAEDPAARVLTPAKLTRAQEETLDLVGVPRERRHPYAGGHVVAEELVFPSMVAPTGNPARWALRWLRERLAPLPERHDRRLYVSRADASMRRVVNEPELFAVLGDRGFERLLPGDLSLSEQLRAFAEAEVVLGPHGSGLANLCASTRTKVIELQREGEFRPCYFAQSTAEGLAYWYLVCPPAGRTDLRVEVPELERTLDAAGIV
jgi:capsular polysaccharide biosynthesis protein